MRRNLTAAVLSTLFLFTFAAHAAAPEQSSGAQAVDEAWRKAMSANDLDAVVACYSKDAVLWLAGAVEAKGREAIRKAFALVLNANTVTEVTFANTHYETAANLSVGWGDYSIALVPKAGGNPVVLSGRFTVVAKQEDGKWVYIIDHASPRPVPEEPGK